MKALIEFAAIWLVMFLVYCIGVYARNWIKRPRIIAEAMAKADIEDMKRQEKEAKESK